MALCFSPVLNLPEFTKPFIMEPDAPDVAVGAILLQYYDNRLYPVAYFSKNYVPSKRSYAPNDKELLIIGNNLQILPKVELLLRWTPNHGFY